MNTMHARQILCTFFIFWFKNILIIAVSMVRVPNSLDPDQPRWFVGPELVRNAAVVTSGNKE